MIFFLLFLFWFFAVAIAVLISIFYILGPVFVKRGFLFENALEADTDVFCLYEQEIDRQPEFFLEERAPAQYETDWDAFYKKLEDITRDMPKRQLTAKER
jgi:hypothetical protein